MTAITMERRRNSERNQLERTLSEDETKDIIAKAEAFRISEEIKMEGNDIYLTVNQVYDIARNVGITKKYVDMALKSTYLNRENMIWELREIGASPAPDRSTSRPTTPPWSPWQSAGRA